MNRTWIRGPFVVALAVLAPFVSHAQQGRPRVPVNRQIEGLSLGMSVREVPAAARRQVLWSKERATLCHPDGRRPSLTTVDCFEAVLDSTEFQTADHHALKLVVLQSRLLRIELEPRTDSKVMQAALTDKYGPPQQDTYWHLEWSDSDTLLQFSKLHPDSKAPTRLIYTDRALLRAERDRLAREKATETAERARQQRQTPKSY
jgi:hypothetical protein